MLKGREWVLGKHECWMRVRYNGKKVLEGMLEYDEVLLLGERDRKVVLEDVVGVHDGEVMLEVAMGMTGGAQRGGNAGGAMDAGSMKMR